MILQLLFQLCWACGWRNHSKQHQIQVCLTFLYLNDWMNFQSLFSDKYLQSGTVPARYRLCLLMFPLACSKDMIACDANSRWSYSIWLIHGNQWYLVTLIVYPSPQAVCGKPIFQVRSFPSATRKLQRRSFCEVFETHQQTPHGTYHEVCLSGMTQRQCSKGLGFLM